LLFEPEENLPEWVLADELRLKQVLINLVNNAIKFTETGTVGIHIKRINAPNDIALQFEVRDTGMGIPKEKLDLLFHSFMQMDESFVRKFEGTGLGLAISKGIVQLWKGRIWVESELNKGSSFFFTFLAQKGQAHMANTQVYNKQLKLTRQPHILIAEDNLFNQEIAKEVMQDIGAKVEIVDNGIKALKKAVTESYDIVLMDIHMPVADGITATRLIRKTKTAEELPIIAVTAYALTENKQLCLKSGMNDFLSKPFIAEDIIKVLHHWLPDFFGKSEITASRAIPDKVFENHTKIDTDYLIPDKALKYFGDEDKYKQYLCHFFDSGIERLSLLGQHLTNKQYDELKQLAHTIKGEASYLGLEKLTRICAETQSEKDHLVLINNTNALIETMKTSLEKIKHYTS
jgi:CheY-like chemotaxis protein/HPt (histidine-containing phosphotransfer) domain-containing protein